ncbi:hypothetical protein C8R46DRAFT_62586 [Mycena filopes]|nr:hypothetical protein C8R46DRAFT_62586 [Mycena filopes]
MAQPYAADFEAEIALNEEVLSDLTSSQPPSNLNRADIASLFLSRILSNIFLRARRPVDKELTSVTTCVSILSKKPRLHEVLKLAHAAKDYSTVEDSPLIPPFVSANTRSYLESLRPEMEKIVRGEKTLCRWTPPTKLKLDKKTLEHIDSLHLYSPNSACHTFSIILHELGSFNDDPILKERTSRIFTEENKFLVNTSGTGKTRLLYEGLCQHWGIYFTVHVDSGNLGSRELETTITHRFERNLDFIENVSSDSVAAKERNSELVFRCFGSILLARLLILQQFLEIAVETGLTEEHKKQWLFMQLSPTTLNPLGDRSVGFAALEELPKILAKEDVTYLRQDVADVLRKIRKLLGPDAAHQFIVLDEAQSAARKFPGAFPSGKPLLAEIMHVWNDLATPEQSFIYAGTDIPKSLVLDSDYVWCSGTGAFDTVEAQRRYLTPFFPPQFLVSPAGLVLVTRISRWLLGRHRFTASAVYLLLLEGFKTPHTRFDDFIKESTGYTPLDAVELVQAEGRDRQVSWERRPHAMDFSPISDEPETKHVFLEILFRYMATQQGIVPFGPEKIDFVGNGWGHCTDADLSVIAVDEAIPLVGAARKLLPHPSSRPAVEQYIPGHPNNYPDTFLGSMRLNAPHSAQALSHCLVFYLARVFGEARPLSDIFNFPHKVPTWANQSGQLVRFHREAMEVENSAVLHTDASLPLATETSSAEETAAWLDHRHGTAFCLPSSSSPDILFALKLADGSFIWVALRAIATDEPIQVDDLKAALSQLEIKNLFTGGEGDDAFHTSAIDALEALPHRSSKLGTHSVLRVVSAFPVEIDLEPCVNKRSRDVASLSLAALEGTKAEVTQPEFFDSIVAGVLAGSKRKAAWDDDGAASEGSHKRHRSATPTLGPTDGEGGEPVPPPPKKRAGKGRAKKPVKEKAAPEPAIGVLAEGEDDELLASPKKNSNPGTGRPKKPAAKLETSSAPVSRNTRSKTKAAAENAG